MNCPKCRALMEIVDYKGIQVDRCINCKGIWFDAMEHKELKKTKGSERIDTGSAEVGKDFNKIVEIDCPVDGTRMVELADTWQTHIWYEACPTCNGVFFDAGEFKDFKEETFGDFFKSMIAKRKKKDS